MQISLRVQSEPIIDKEWSLGALNWLKKYGIKSVGDLARCLNYPPSGFKKLVERKYLIEMNDFLKTKKIIQPRRLRKNDERPQRLPCHHKIKNI